MARTYEKRFKMDTTKEIPTFLALDELEFFDTPVFGDDDVFVADLKSQEEDGGEFSAGEILEELDFQDGGEILGSDWLTDKFDFNTFDPALEGTSETLAQLTQIEEAPIPDNLLDDHEFLKVLQDSCIPGTEMFPTPVEMPTTPEQKVPEYESLSPYSPTSSDSFLADESNPASPCSTNSSTSNDTLDQVTVRELLISSAQTHQAEPMSQKDAELPDKQEICRGTPYSREKPKTQTVQPKVKSPAQRQRKRVQNKDAATRYRVKKKDEQTRLSEEADVLEKENSDLKDKVNSIAKEIEYLKNLMIEVYKTKQKQKQADLKKK